MLNIQVLYSDDDRSLSLSCSIARSLCARRLCEIRLCGVITRERAKLCMFIYSKSIVVVMVVEVVKKL